MRRVSLQISGVAMAVALLGGCGAREQARETVVASPPTEVLPPFQQEIASVKAEVTLPGSWRYGYRMVDRADTAHGAFRAIEFHYTADSARGVKPALLMVIRAFKKPAWDKAIAATPDFARKLAEHNDEVYGFSVVTQSPYPVGSTSTLRVDQMMMALMADTSPFKLNFK